jgi:hypothetical protein
MKKKSYCTALLFTIFTQQILTCPTCIGRIHKDTPPIFSPEYDKQFWPEQPLISDKTKKQENVALQPKIISLYKGKLR